MYFTNDITELKMKKWKNQIVHDQNEKTTNLECIIDDNKTKVIKNEQKERNKIIVIGMSQELTEENVASETCKIVEINLADLHSITKIEEPNAKNEQWWK